MARVGWSADDGRRPVDEHLLFGSPLSGLDRVAICVVVLLVKKELGAGAYSSAFILRVIPGLP